MYPSRIRPPSQTSTTPRRCQRCEQPDHATYECKNPRPYKSRPTRVQTLADPKLDRKLRQKQQSVLLPDGLRRRSGPSAPASASSTRGNGDGVATEVLRKRRSERDDKDDDRNAFLFSFLFILILLIIISLSLSVAFLPHVFFSLPVPLIQQPLLSIAQPASAQTTAQPEPVPFSLPFPNLLAPTLAFQVTFRTQPFRLTSSLALEISLPLNSSAARSVVGRQWRRLLSHE
ncbi:hypothetical protein ACQY0O_002593 [Thecaphora frezii]